MKLSQWVVVIATVLLSMVPAHAADDVQVLTTTGSPELRAITATDFLNSLGLQSCSGCNIVSAWDIGVTPNNSADDDAIALDAYLTEHPSNRVVHFPTGTYEFKTSVFLENLSNVKIDCAPGAVIKKNEALTKAVGQYLLAFRDSNNIEISGCRFEGLTVATTANDFGEQGIICASCDGFYVHNSKFFNIGDAAIRSTTGSTSGNSADSRNTLIANNYFYNVSQVTTTPAGTSVSGTGLGGTSNYWVVGNTFDLLRGSVKVSTRFPVSGAFVLNNIIHSSHDLPTSTGIEICSYREVIISGNIIDGSQSWAINDYTNVESSLNAFDWYDHDINHNIIFDVARGIRVSNVPYSGDGLSSNTSGISVNNNTIRNVTTPKGPVGIVFVNGVFRASSAHDNLMTGMASGLYTSLPTGVSDNDNTKD